MHFSPFLHRNSDSCTADVNIFTESYLCQSVRGCKYKYIANTNVNTNTNLARHPLAAFLVRLISTVVVAVALFLLRDEQTVLPPVNFALVVLRVIFEQIGQVCFESHLVVPFNPLLCYLPRRVAADSCSSVRRFCRGSQLSCRTL